MKRFLLSLMIVVLAIGPVAHAEGPTLTILNDSQLSLVRKNCVRAKSSLERIRANDALARINLAREYDALSNKLMAPMNSRVALNKLNGIDLTKTAVDFDKEVENFRATYQKYEQSISHAIQTNCTDDPAEFYSSIERARFYRDDLRVSVENLEKLINQYRTQLDKLELSKASKNDA